MTISAKLNFKPKHITRRLFTVLPERSRDVLVSRFGLDENPERMTLEAIGDVYGITRERVRQIENHAIENIKRSDGFSAEAEVLKELKDIIDLHGGILSEENLLDLLGKDQSTKNHIHMLLVLGDAFEKNKEDAQFRHRWSIDPFRASVIHSALSALAGGLSKDDLIPDRQFIGMFFEHLKDLSAEHCTEENAKRWLLISKKISQNPLNEWGLSESPNVRVKGVRDFAYLTIRQHGSPMHFSEVSREITRIFGRPAHEATCHNELIKDSRFVLVGRGLYALSEWGYAGGVVRDVISEVLRRSGPLTKEELIEKVLKERYVKENTVLVNLENPKYFKRDGEGRYVLV